MLLGQALWQKCRGSRPHAADMVPCAMLASVGSRAAHAQCLTAARASPDWLCRILLRSACSAPLTIHGSCCVTSREPRGAALGLSMLREAASSNPPCMCTFPLTAPQPLTKYLRECGTASLLQARAWDSRHLPRRSSPGCCKVVCQGKVRPETCAAAGLACIVAIPRVRRAVVYAVCKCRKGHAKRPRMRFCWRWHVCASNAPCLGGKPLG